MQTFRKAGNGHIRTTNKAIHRADDRANRRGLSLGGQLTDHQRRKACAKQHHNYHIANQHQNMGKGHIPAGDIEVEKAGNQCHKTNHKGGKGAGKVISQRKGAALHGRNGQILVCTGGFILHHQKIGAEGHRHTANCQQRRQQLSAHQAVHQAILDGDPFRHSHQERIFIDLSQKHGIQHQQNKGCDQGSKEQTLIFEEKFGVPLKKGRKLGHFPSPPSIFLPVAAKNTSSILPLVISKSLKSSGFLTISSVAWAVFSTLSRKPSRTTV